MQLLTEFNLRFNNFSLDQNIKKSDNRSITFDSSNRNLHQG